MEDKEKSKNVKTEIKTLTEQAKKNKVLDRTKGVLKSRAEYIIPVTLNNKTVFIPPFGQIPVVKEELKIDPMFSRYLVFVKS